MNVCGIDPGLSGALAVLNESGVVLVEDLPIYQLPSSKDCALNSISPRCVSCYAREQSTTW